MHGEGTAIITGHFTHFRYLLTPSADIYRALRTLCGTI